MTNTDQKLDGTTRPLSAFDSVTLRYTSVPHIPTNSELVALAEQSASFREEVLALPADDHDPSLGRAKLLCQVAKAKAAAINAIEELR